MSRPASRGSNPLSRCGRQVTRVQPSPADLPEWGSGAASYGRECIMEPVRQLGTADGAGGRGGPSARSAATPGAAAESGGGGRGSGGLSNSNEASADNPLAVRLSRPAAGGGRCAGAGSADRAAASPAAPGRRRGPGTRAGSYRDQGAPHAGAGDAPGGGAPAAEWPCETVQQWLERAGWGALAARFGQESVDGEALLELQDEDLASLGVTRLGDRKKLLKQIRLLRSESAMNVSLKRPADVDEGFFHPEEAGPWDDPDGGYHEDADLRQGAGGRRPQDREAPPAPAAGGPAGHGQRGGTRSRSPSGAPPDAHPNGPSRDDPPACRTPPGGARATGGSPTGAPPNPHSNEPSLDNPLVCRMPPRIVRASAGGTPTGSPPNPHSNEPSQENPLAFRRSPGGAGVAHGPPAGGPPDPHSNEPSQDNPLAFRRSPGGTRAVHWAPAGGPPDPHSNEPSQGNPLAPRRMPGGARAAHRPLAGSPPDPHSNEPSQENPLAFRRPHGGARAVDGSAMRAGTRGEGGGGWAWGRRGHSCSEDQWTGPEPATYASTLAAPPQATGRIGRPNGPPDGDTWGGAY
uniref:SAM domain-containing protein n=1 Tax=Alexandrium monilatum TaxID=311494 RepID=A0A7S4PYC7_9DINO